MTLEELKNLVVNIHMDLDVNVGEDIPEDILEEILVLSEEDELTDEQIKEDILNIYRDDIDDFIDFDTFKVELK